MEFLMNTVTNRPATSFSDTCKLKTIEAAFGIMDVYTQGHGQRVTIYAMHLARRVGLAPDEVDNIALGGLLHDIGKVGLSRRIFRNKEATLSNDMLAEVRLHPLIGASILRSIVNVNDLKINSFGLLIYRHQTIFKQLSNIPCYNYD